MSFATLQVPAVPIRFLPIQRESATRAPTTLKTHCSSCHLREVCLPCGLEPEDVTHLDHLGFGRRRVKAGNTLYHEGSSFKFIYAVRSGTFKSSLALSDGREQVSGFHVAGELIGLDGVAHGTHASSSIALEDSEICAIPYAQLTEMSEGSNSLQRSVSRLMSREIVREHSLLLLLGSMGADERLAAFLLNLSQRLKSLGYSASEFHLRMSRAEIGSYLGMTLETVSRTFSSFQQRRLMEVDRRHICINDMDGLKQVFETRMR